MRSAAIKTISVLTGLLVLLALMNAQPEMTQAQISPWSIPVNISHSPVGSWFPDMAVDNENNVHVVWCETTAVPLGHIEQVYYSLWDGQVWTEPNDVVPPSPDIVRNAIAADQAGYVHMLFGGSVPSIGHLSLYYMNAPIEGARSAAKWSRPHSISGVGSYMGDIAIAPAGSIHVIYDRLVSSEEKVEGEEFEVQVSDIFYRYSTDGGTTWSFPVNLFPSPSTGSAREQMEIDREGVIHVTWDEGWDRLTGRGVPFYSVYTSSSDGGLSWRAPITVTYPTTGTVQMTPGADGRGGVMLVWRLTLQDGIYYQWSNDGGNSWSPPATIPGIFAGRWRGPWDVYDMTTDSAGHIHLVAVAVARRSTESDTPGSVYHLEWDGASWSRPELIYAGEGFPEYPKITVSRGNQLHAVWFVRDDLSGETRREVWYSNSQSAAPPQTPVPSPTPVPTPTATPKPPPTPTITPFPTLSSDVGGLPDGLYTESDEVLRLMIALSPVVLLVVAVVIVRRGWFKILLR
jgi:hypothetical protein